MTPALARRALQAGLALAARCQVQQAIRELRLRAPGLLSELGLEPQVTPAGATQNPLSQRELGVAVDRPGQLQSGNRRPPVYLLAHRQDPCTAHPQQTRGGAPHSGGGQGQDAGLDGLGAQCLAIFTRGGAHGLAKALVEMAGAGKTAPQGDLTQGQRVLRSKVCARARRRASRY